MRVRQAGLERKLKKWMKYLKLEGWDIKIRFKNLSDDEPDNKGLATAAQVEYCSPVERTALIFIANDYCETEGYGLSFNIDTLIIHELLHVILWEKFDCLSTRTKKNQKIVDLEEFICFHFSKILYDVKRKQ